MVAAVVGVTAVAGSAMQANAAGDASDSQSASSQKATQAQMMAAAQMRQDLSPWVGTGRAANNRLSQYLGLGVAPGSTMSNGMQAGLTRDQLRQQLLQQYTRQAPAGSNAAPGYADGNAAMGGLGEMGAYNWANSLARGGRGMGNLGGTGNGLSDVNNAPGTGPGYWSEGADGNRWVSTGQQQTGPGSTVDEEGLNAAIDKYYADQAAEQARMESDPNYGSLLRAYRNGEEFSFTGKDLATDPGYQFGLNQGTQGIERAQASRGNFLSGAAIKEATRFNEDYAGTKFNEGFGRAQSTWNTNLGAYNQNRNTIYNFLTGQSTMGQNSAAQVGVNNQQTANNVGNNMMASGNAQAAGMVAGGNALANGMNQAANAYNSSNPNSAAGWNSLLNRNGGGYSGYTGYVGGSDPIANLNTTNGWTS